jgi:tetratricopeptide (TPR) repeat protein
MVGFTGIAHLRGSPVADWIVSQMDGLGSRASIDDLLEALKTSEAIVPPRETVVSRKLTFAVGAMIGSQSLLAIVSNFERFIAGRIRRSLEPSDQMTITQIKPKSGSYFVTGDIGAVKADDSKELLLHLRAGVPDLQIQEELNALNIAISERTTTISPGSYAASLHASGEGSGRPFLTDEQEGDFIPPEFAAMLRASGLRLNRRTDAYGRPMPIRLVQSASNSISNKPEYYREQFKIHPNSAELWNNYGSLLVHNRRRAEGLKAFAKAVELDPKHAAALANHARLTWLDLRDFHEADRLYKRAIAAGEPSPDPSYLSDYACFCYEALGDAKRAAEFHDRAAANAHFPLAWAQKAWFMARSGADLDAAQDLMNKALEKEPQNAQIIYLDGLIDLQIRQDHTRAIGKLHRAASLDPSNDAILSTTAQVALSLRDSASAAYYSRKLIERGIDDPQLRGHYGLALLAERKVDGALRHLEAASSSLPNDMNIRVNYAAALYSRQPNEAAKLLQSVIANAESSPETTLEASAMLCIAAPESRRDSSKRIRQFIGQGTRVDGATVRAMVIERKGRLRAMADMLAQVVEGSVVLPGDW